MDVPATLLMARLKRKTPEPEADRSDPEMSQYLLSSEGSSLAIDLLRQIAAEELRQKHSEEKAFVDIVFQNWDEWLTWIGAMEEKVGITPPPFEAPEPLFFGADLDDLNGTVFAIVKPEDYQDSKRQIGNDGLIRYYGHNTYTSTFFFFI